MPWNPCGAICDYGRRPYTTTCRPFPDSDITAQIVWYPANKGAAHLPYPSAFMSRDWERDFCELEGVGEVYDTPRNFNRRVAIPGAVGAHVCGTEEQFAGHAVYDPSVNVAYNRDGLPLCCGVPEVPVGGLLLGGAAVVGYTPGPSGAICSDPITLALDGPASGSVTGPFDNRWYHIDLPIGGNYRVEPTVTAGGVTTYIYTGGCTGSLYKTLLGTDCWTIPADQPRDIRIRMNGQTGGGSYTLRVRTGACGT